MARTMRVVIENWSVSEVVDAEQAIYPRLADAFDALKWWLAREPDSGETIDDVNWLYMQDGDARKNIPALVVVYTFNAWEVELKHILVRVPR
ncbi:MAG: hypothetical protein ABSF53_06845 [Terracidiphilus sp.]|jgi:hypothetical protein